MARPKNPVLLVSLCNPDTAGQPTLLIVDPISWSVAPVERSAGFAATGICRIRDDVLIAGQTAKATVAIFDARSFQLRALIEMPGARDLHSLVPWEGGLAAVSTGTDELLWYGYDNNQLSSRTVLWAAGPSRSDTVHLNGLATHHGRLVCSAFGPRFRDFDVWSESQDGFVYDVTRERFVLRGLARPHTITFIGDELFICESSRRNFRSAQRSIVNLDGYTRGVSPLDDGRVVVATSQSRVRSRSTGRQLDPPPNGQDDGSCALHVIDFDGVLQKTIPLGHYGREIYDVFLLR